MLLDCAHAFHASCLAALERHLGVENRRCALCRKTGYAKHVTKRAATDRRAAAATVLTGAARARLAVKRTDTARRAFYGAGRGEARAVQERRPSFPEGDAPVEVVDREELAIAPEVGRAGLQVVTRHRPADGLEVVADPERAAGVGGLRSIGRQLRAVDGRLEMRDVGGHGSSLPQPLFPGATIPDSSPTLASERDRRA